MTDGFSKKRRFLQSHFILRPWGFLIFLVLGAGTFFYLALKIHIPVYSTVETVAEEENGMLRVDLHDSKFEMGTPVFLYVSRDDHLEKVTAYKVKDGWMLTEPIDTLPDSGRLYADIQIGETSLLKHILSLEEGRH